MLGTVERDHDSFIIADIPGLIEGAHEGKGLGDRFLGHVERCAALVHLVDGTQDDVVGAYRTIRHELETYGHGLSEKPEILASPRPTRWTRRRWQPAGPSWRRRPAAPSTPSRPSPSAGSGRCSTPPGRSCRSAAASGPR